MVAWIQLVQLSGYTHVWVRSGQGGEITPSSMAFPAYVDPTYPYPWVRRDYLKMQAL